MSELFHWIIDADHSLFRLVNSSMANPVLDSLLPWCREKWVWAPLYLFLLVWIVQNMGIKKGSIAIAGLVIAAGLADFTSSELIKKNVKRVRPCNDISLRETVKLRIDHCGSGYSFTSSHAANHFAAATYLIFILGGENRKYTRWLLLWAGTISFAQVYVGVHFPLDITFGGFLGAGIGMGIAKIFSSFLNHFPNLDV